MGVVNVKSHPVAPNSVHVWRGFKNPAKTVDEFAEFLGSVFVPACSLLQPNAGLKAYVPSMPAFQGKPNTVPDQSALMFWTHPDTHQKAFKTVAVRAYTNLHGDAYGKGSSAQFPIPLGNQLHSEQPYYLIDKPADWMLGQIEHLIGARPDDVSTADFHQSIFHWAGAVKSDPTPGLEGALICAGDNYVVAWLLWKSDPPAGPMARLTAKTQPWLNQISETYDLPAGLWDDWPGIKLTMPGSLNIQLNRPDA